MTQLFHTLYMSMNDYKALQVLILWLQIILVGK